MASWSKDQSQSMGRVAATSSGIRTRSMHLLVPLTERQKAQLRRENGVKSRWAADNSAPAQVVKYREQLAPMKPDFVSKRKRRGMSGCKMSPEVRAMVHERLKLREAFFRED